MKTYRSVYSVPIASLLSEARRLLVPRLLSSLQRGSKHGAFGSFVGAQFEPDVGWARDSLLFIEVLGLNIGYISTVCSLCFFGGGVSSSCIPGFFFLKDLSLVD